MGSKKGMPFQMCTVPVSVKSWMKISFRISLILVSSFYSPHVEGEYQVIGPSQAVLAKAGDDVTLPCHIEPPRSADRMTVEWSRPDLKPMFAHVRQQGHEVSHSHLNLLYQQRTSLFAEELPHGNISLKLSGVQLSDEGTFKCFVPNLRSSSLIQLRVGAVSQPVISFGQKDDSFALTCDSGCWYPEPEVSWLDSGGNFLPADPSVTVRGSSHCYTVQRNLTLRGAGDVTCRVHLPHINHTLVEIHRVSDHISTEPIDMFNSTESTGTLTPAQTTGIIGIGIGTGIVLVCGIVRLVIRYRRSNNAVL